MSQFSIPIALCPAKLESGSSKMFLRLFPFFYLFALSQTNKAIQPMKARQIRAQHLDGRNPLVVKVGIKRLSQCSSAADEHKPRRPRFFIYNNITQECTFIMGRNSWFLFWHGPAHGKAATAFVDWRHWKPGERIDELIFTLV